jgi:hypothetical protein
MFLLAFLESDNFFEGDQTRGESTDRTFEAPLGVVAEPTDPSANFDVARQVERRHVSCFPDSMDQFDGCVNVFVQPFVSSFEVEDCIDRPARIVLLAYIDPARENRRGTVMHEPCGVEVGLDVVEEGLEGVASVAGGLEVDEVVEGRLAERGRAQIRSEIDRRFNSLARCPRKRANMLDCPSSRVVCSVWVSAREVDEARAAHSAQVRLRENLFGGELDSGLEHSRSRHDAVLHQGSADGMELDSFNQLGGQPLGFELVEVGEAPSSRASTNTGSL